MSFLLEAETVEEAKSYYFANELKLRPADAWTDCTSHEVFPFSEADDE